MECVRHGFLKQYIEEQLKERAVLDLVLAHEKGFINDLETKMP